MDKLKQLHQIGGHRFLMRLLFITGPIYALVIPQPEVDHRRPLNGSTDDKVMELVAAASTSGLVGQPSLGPNLPVELSPAGKQNPWFNYGEPQTWYNYRGPPAPPQQQQQPEAAANNYYRYQPPSEPMMLQPASYTDEMGAPYFASGSQSESEPGSDLPALRTTFLKDVLDYLFLNNTNKMADNEIQAPYQEVEQQLPEVKNDLEAPEYEYSNIAKRYATVDDDHDTGSSLFKGSAAAQPSPLLLKHLTNLESLLRSSSEQNQNRNRNRFKVKDDLLHELSLPVLLKPIIITIPENDENVKKVVQRSIDNGGASMDSNVAEYNLLEIPAVSTSGVPNTYHVYGKHNFLIVQSPNATRDVEPVPKEALKPTRQVGGGDDLELEAIRNCDCQVKCHSCKNDGNAVRNNVRRLSSRATSPQFASRQSVPLSEILGQNFDLEISNMRGRPMAAMSSKRNVINSPSDSKLLSFDVVPAAEVPPSEYSDLDFLVADAAKVRFQNGAELASTAAIESEHLMDDALNEITEKHNIVKKYLSSEAMLAAHIDSI